MVVDEESCRDAAKWLKKPYDSRRASPCNEF